MVDHPSTPYVSVPAQLPDDVRAVLPHLRSLGLKVGLASVKLLQPFPEAELVEALRGKKAVTVLARSDQTALTALVTQALFRARENAHAGTVRHAGIPAIDELPVLTTAIFGLGGHDLQPRHLVAACTNMATGSPARLVYLGSQFFDPAARGRLSEVQERLRAAYPEKEGRAALHLRRARVDRLQVQLKPLAELREASPRG